MLQRRLISKTKNAEGEWEVVNEWSLDDNQVVLKLVTSTARTKPLFADVFCKRPGGSTWFDAFDDIMPEEEEIAWYKAVIETLGIEGGAMLVFGLDRHGKSRPFWENLVKGETMEETMKLPQRVTEGFLRCFEGGTLDPGS